MTEKANSDDLLEKIVADYTRLFRSGNPPAIGKYKYKHPELANEIEELLSSVAMIEGLKIESASSNDGGSDNELANRKQLGDYLLIRELGRGGMGVVFEAVHQSLGRRVALKVMRKREIDDEKYIARFRREAQAAAQLHHTNIVSVFGVGECDGYHYYVMEFIDGTPLNHVVKTISWRVSESVQDSTKNFNSQPAETVALARNQNAPETPTTTNTESDEFMLNSSNSNDLANVQQLVTGKARYRWLANVGSQIADALSYAHGQGILHRDVKPANLLVDQQDQVWITDFGLVKLNENIDSLTKTGDLIGTPQYMAPESFKGEYNARSEVYCLGLTLYELATLRPAFQNGSTGEVIHAITTSSPPSPKKIDPSIPRDLNTIIEKAISRDPTSRYPSAIEMRDDLRAFYDDRPIAATKPSVFEQAWRWGRRNPLVATLTALSAVLLCAVAATASVGYAWTTAAYSRLADEARSTEAARNLAVENERTAIANEQKIQKEFARAEANISLTIEAFDDILRGIVAPGSQNAFEFQGLGELGGIETAVTVKDAEILSRIVGFYERFAQQNTESESLKMETAKAFRRVANINHLIGETETAIKAYDKSLAIYQPVLDNSPESTEALLNVVDIRSELIAAIRRQEDFRRAEDENRETVRMIEAHSKRELPAVQLALAKTLASAGSTVVSMVAATNSSNFTQSLEDERGSQRFQFRRASKQSMPLIKQHMVGVERAIKIGESLLAQEPENEKYRSLLCECFTSLGAVQISLGGDEVKRGKRSITRAIEQFESLAAEFEENQNYKYSLALASLLLPAGDASPETKDRIRQVTEISDELIGKSPNPEYKQLKVVAHIKMASVLLEDEKPQEALAEQTKAYDIMQTLDREIIGRLHLRNIRTRLSANYLALSQFYEKSGDRRSSGQMRKLANEFTQQQGRYRGIGRLLPGFGGPPHHPQEGRPRGGGARPGRGGKEKGGDQSRER